MINSTNLAALEVMQEAAFSHGIDAREFCGLSHDNRLISLEDDLLLPADPDTLEGFVDLGSALSMVGNLVFTKGVGFKGLAFVDGDGGLKLLNEEGGVSLLDQDSTESTDNAVDESTDSVDATEDAVTENATHAADKLRKDTISMPAVDAPTKSVTIDGMGVGKDKAITEPEIGGKNLPNTNRPEKVIEKSKNERSHEEMTKSTALRKSLNNKKGPIVQASARSLDNGRITSYGPKGTVYNYNTAQYVKSQGNNLAEITRAIKDRINVKDYAEQNGFSFRSVGDSYRSNSIIGGSNKTCLAIRKDNPDYFTDFKSGDSGDVITFCAILHHDGEFYPALQELAELTGVELKSGANAEIFSKRAELPERVRYWNNALLESSGPLDYVKRRLGDKAVDTIKRLKLGWSEKRHRVMIPYLKGNRPVYFAGRYFGKADKAEPKYKKATTQDYGEQPCWGEDTLRRESPLVLAEGAFDAISFEQEGYSVLSLFGGNASQYQRQIVRNAARAKAEQGEEAILVFDTDEAGKSFTKQMANDLFERGIPFKTAMVPEGFKDVSEYYEVHRNVKGILATAISGLDYMLASHVGNESQFEKFARKACRNMSKPEIASMFKRVKDMEKFEKTWLNELEKVCKAPPTQPQIVSEILEKHDLVYIDGVGFFEYNDGIWEEKCEEDIKAYAMEQAGPHATNALNEACKEMLKTEAKSKIEFNRKWLIQFNNGVLDFETGELRPPRRSDYIVGISPYDYDPEAKCPLFEETVREIMGDDEEKIRFLKQTMGYVVIAPENFMHKCLYLIGKGRNGKGVMLRVIEDVLGDANVSHVAISQLQKEWGRMRLEHSRVNVSAEEMENLRGTESYFKSATGGDMLDGNWKNENAIEFRSPATWIVAANQLPNMKDTSDGTLSRLLFIQFGEKYIDRGNPIGEHQHDVDPHLSERLKGERAGIFNWFYEGYKEFLANGERFDYSSEHDEIMHDLKMKLNAVAYFLESYFFDEVSDRDEFDTEEAYESYSEWCKKFGYKTPYNEHNFATELKSEILEEPTVWRKRRSNKKKRGYERKPECRINPPKRRGRKKKAKEEPPKPETRTPNQIGNQESIHPRNTREYFNPVYDSE